MESSKYNIWYVIVSSLILIFLSIQGSYFAPINDFGNYYFGSLFLLKGQMGSWMYDPASFNLAILELGVKNFFLNYTPVPPITALFYIPLVFLEVETAKLVFNLFGSGLFLFAVFKLLAHLKLPIYGLPIAVFSMVLVLKSNLDQGQTYLLISALIIFGYLMLEQGKAWSGTLLWSIAILLKLFPAILLLYFILRKDWKNILRTSIWVLGLFLLSLLFIPWEIWIGFIFEILPRLMVGEINDPFSSTYQSFTVLLRELLVLDVILNAQSLANLPWLFNPLDTALKLFFFYIGISIAVQMKHSFLRMAWILFMGIIISGYGTFYCLILLLPMILANGFKFKNKIQLATAVILILICLLPVQWFAELPLLLKFPRLWLFLIVFSLIWARFQVKIDFRIVSGIVLIGIVIGFSKTQIRPKSELLPSPSGALLSYDYEVLNDSILVSYWTPNGPSTFAVSCTDVKADSTNLTNFDHQIQYKGKSITSGKQRCKKPAFVGNNRLIYLSDQDRGVGFYALRIMELDNLK